MGFFLKADNLNKVLLHLSSEYNIYAPRRVKDGHRFSDLDMVRYDKIEKVEDIVFNEKSAFSFKEALLPINEVLFYFTENEAQEPQVEAKGNIIFLRSCDLAAVKRLDEIYLNNGEKDFYYERLRKKTKFVLMACPQEFENCFCVSFQTNNSVNYDFAIEESENGYLIDNKTSSWESLFSDKAEKEKDYQPSFVKENKIKVKVSEKISEEAINLEFWNQYDSRCIDCGRCNFSCPTCTCFSMQDIFYQDNKNVGERRRVWASCMVDGYTDVAGGGAYRQKNGQRMRFKVLHKIFDFKKRYSYQMCVGCGRCDDVCPEYISFSNCLNMLSAAVEGKGEK